MEDRVGYPGSLDRVSTEGMANRMSLIPVRIRRGKRKKQIPINACLTKPNVLDNEIDRVTDGHEPPQIPDLQPDSRLNAFGCRFTLYRKDAPRLLSMRTIDVSQKTK